MTTYTVVRVNRDPKDTHAAETYKQAYALASPDASDFAEMALVTARDAGAARLVDDAFWIPIVKAP